MCVPCASASDLDDFAGDYNRAASNGVENGNGKRSLCAFGSLDHRLGQRMVQPKHVGLGRLTGKLVKPGREALRKGIGC